MIQATEFRIGNWVSNGENNYTVDVNMLYDLVTLESYKMYPISLTPEILIACGFEKRGENEDGAIYGKENFTIIYALSDDGERRFFLNGYHNDVDIRFLHHLQNIWHSLRQTEIIINLK